MTVTTNKARPPIIRPMTQPTVIMKGLLPAIPSWTSEGRRTDGHGTAHRHEQRTNGRHALRARGLADEREQRGDSEHDDRHREEESSQERDRRAVSAEEHPQG